MKKQNKQKGITLVALVITIIILLILAGITISSLTQTSLFTKANEAKEKTEDAKVRENTILNEFAEGIDEVVGGSGGTPADPSLPTNPATTIAEAQSDYMLTKTVNSPIRDAYGNKITIPAGFKIKADSTTNNATKVNEGIVIIDSNSNEFVWIPVGKIYTDTEKTDANAKTINLGRYSFADDGTESAYSDSDLEEDSTDTANLKNYGNTIAKNINDFKTKASATQSGGFYIGRYEARTATARSAETNPLTTISENGSQYIYNYVKQTQAADLARNMYGSDKPFTSDLMNSYAWDTAILFIQKCGNNSSTYSRNGSVNSSLATTGTNDTTKYKGTQDAKCNVYDMASNVLEWTTETSNRSGYPCVGRGGYCNNSGYYTSFRDGNSASNSYENIGFRPLLYL